MSWLDAMLERNLLPDPLIRLGIRRLIRERHRMETEGGAAAQQARLMDWVRRLRESPIAIETDAANDQHYEVPAAFFERVLGRHLKYSCGHWPEGVEHRNEIRRVLRKIYGADQETRWWAYWRIFFLACAELWAWRGGEEWLVTHLLFEKPSA